MIAVKQKILIAFFWLTFGSLWSQPLEYRVTLGGRGAGLGESAIALPPSPLSIYYNPAALGFLQQGGLLIESSNLYGANVYERVAAAATPIPLPYGRNKQGGFGVIVNFEGVNDDDLHYGRYIISSALALPLSRRLAVGVNFKVVSTNNELKNTGQGSNSNSGTGLDLSLHYQIPFAQKSFVRQMDMAVAAYDVYNTRVSTLVPDSSEILFGRTVRGGAAIHFHDFLSSRSFALRKPALLMQLDDRWHLGAEATLFNTLALRAGYAHDIGDPGESVLTFGFGLDLDERAGNVQFDYAYVHPEFLPDRHLFTLHAPILKGPPQVALAEPDIAPIFASYYLSYPSSPAAQHNSVQIENLTNTTLTGKFTQLDAPFGISLDEKTAAAFSLEPKERRTVRLPLQIASSILVAQDLSQPVQAKLHFEYALPHSDKRRRFEKNITLLVHGKNYLTWDELGREAAFITPEDRRVQALRERVALPLSDPSWQLYRPIYRAAQFYEALIENGFAYLPDTKLRFDSLYATHGFDKIKYPAELLAARAESRRGDCDDLTALYASLLESDNLATALVGTSDHVLVLFDTGIPISRRALLPLPDSLLLSFSNTADFGLNDRLWLPVEVTAIGRSRAEALPFYAAVVQGAAYIREAEADSLLSEIVSTASAWDKFPAALPPDDFLPPQNLVAAIKRTSNALAGLNRFRNDYIQKLAANQSFANDNGLAAGIQFATYCAYLGNYHQADSILAQLGKRFGERFELLNNRGNLALLREQYEQAARFYAEALKSQPDFLQGYLNRIALNQERLLAHHGHPDSLSQAIKRDSLVVCRLYEAKHRDRDRSLIDLQGLPFFFNTGRGTIQNDAAAKSPETSATTFTPQRSVMRRLRDFFHKLNKRLSPPDPRIGRIAKAGGRGDPVLREDLRLVELLYWCAGPTSAFAAK